jgi:hypothetical protein
MTRPLAVAVGFIGKSPLAGMTLYNLHYLAGLQDLGYDVHYVEQQNSPWDCYDPAAGTFTEDPAYGVRYLSETLARYVGLGPDRFSFLDLQGRCHGSGWEALRTTLESADFLLTLEDGTWSDEFERCPRRAFLDGDPLFTQVDLLEGETDKAAAVQRYDVLFTYCTRMGAPDCTVPSAGREWLPTRPAVATRLWNPAPTAKARALTTVMHWGAWRDYEYDGRVYGHKNRELERFMELPLLSEHEFVLAVGGGSAPKDHLAEAGWSVLESADVTRDINVYTAFIDGSFADFGVAKHAYVASRGGWFSDRSTCYLAAGRPVLHQETGFSDWLPTGEGVLAFESVNDVLVALEELERDYERHASAARGIAEEYFEAENVIGQMLDAASFR